MDNYYVRYLKRFLNYELGISNRVLGPFDKNDQQALINYLNLPNVMNMFDVQEDILNYFPALETDFNMTLENDEIVYVAKTLSSQMVNYIKNNIEALENYCKSIGWELETVDDWIDLSKDINLDEVIDSRDRDIIYDVIRDVGTYDTATKKRCDLNLDGTVDYTDLNIFDDYVNNTKLSITIRKSNRKNYFPNDDMKVFVNQFDGTFMYNYAIRDNGTYGRDDLPHKNPTGKYKIALYKCKPGQKITIAHSSGNDEHIIIGSSAARLKSNISNLLLENVVDMTLRSGESVQYTTTSVADGTGYDAQWVCIQCPSSYNNLTDADSKSIELLRGDVNLDGKIDMEDYALLADYTAEGPGASELPYNKANWTPTSKQLLVMDIPIPDESSSSEEQFGEAGIDGEINRADAVELYRFITGQSSQPTLGTVTYTYSINDGSESDADNIDTLLIIDGHYDRNVNIPFEEFRDDAWIVHEKFYNYLLDMAIQPYSNSEDITYLQKLLRYDMETTDNPNISLYPGEYSDDMKQLVTDFQRSLIYYTKGDLNRDGKLDNKDLILMRQIIECMNADIDGDDKPINQDDFNLLRDYLNGTVELTAEQLERADVNFDGVINSQDLAIIQEFLDGTREDIMHTTKTSGPEYQTIMDQRDRADVNKDGKINKSDYYFLEREIRGETDFLTHYYITFILGWYDVQTEGYFEGEYNINQQISEVSK